MNKTNLGLPMSAKKKVLVPWSGGVDSTAVIARAVETGHQVTVVSLVCGQPSTQITAEEAAREKCRPLLEALAPDGHTNIFTVFSSLDLSTSRTSLPSRQMGAWFYHLTSMMKCNHGYEYDEIHLGYVLGDDACGSTTHLAAAWDSFCRAMHGDMFDPPKLRFPFMHTRKGEVIRYLERHGLLEHVHYCELPQLYDDGWKPCGQCPACYNHTRAIEAATMYEKVRFLGNLLQDYDHRTKAEGAINESE